MTRPRILVVNAQPVIAEAVALLIRIHTSFPVHVCHSHVQVIDCIHSFEPEVVLINLNEPDVAAELCLCRTITHSTADRTVVLVAPGFMLVDQSLIADAFESGADGVLNQTTLTIEQLTAALEKLASGQSLWDGRELRQAMLRRGERTQLPVSTQMMTEFTPREREIFAMLSIGASNKQIAQDLQISERTAQKHVSNILLKLGVNSRTQAIAAYYQWQQGKDVAQRLAV